MEVFIFLTDRKEVRRVVHRSQRATIPFAAFFVKSKVQTKPINYHDKDSEI